MTLTLLIASWLISGVVAAYLWLPPKRPMVWFDLVVLICGAFMGYVMVLIALLCTLVEAKFWRKPIWPP